MSCAAEVATGALDAGASSCAFVVCTRQVPIQLPAVGSFVSVPRSNGYTRRLLVKGFQLDCGSGDGQCH
jgi:hypothetical protein